MSGGFTRRAALKLAGAAPLWPSPRGACGGGAGQSHPLAGKTGLHGLSVFGELKYPKDFKQLDYVDATAPKGGRMNFQPPNWVYNQSTQTFNTLNTFVLKGDAPPRIELIFDTLMARCRRRARRDLRPRRRNGRRVGRRQRLHLSPAPRGALP